MPRFLSRQEVYRLLQRELPEDVYADGAPSAHFTTAENDSVAQTIAVAYSNAERIYENFFPLTADEKIADWERAVFDKIADAASALEDRRAKVVGQLRKQPSIDEWQLLTLVASYLPEGKFVQIVQWAKSGWKLGVSRFGINARLGFGRRDLLPEIEEDLATAILDQGWKLGSSRLGVDTRLGGKYSYLLRSSVQLKAYTYEIRIFDYTVPSVDLANLVPDLREAEPARSRRIIRQNLDLDQFGLTETVENVGQFSGVNCITRDNASSTGYSGRQTIYG